MPFEFFSGRLKVNVIGVKCQNGNKLSLFGP